MRVISSARRGASQNTRGALPTHPKTPDHTPTGSVAARGDHFPAGDHWTNEHAKRHAAGAHVKDPYRLRLNAYRVLLTRGRDGAVIFVPPDSRLDATAAWLQGHGVKVLG